jgi:hypothetical protein
MNVGAETMKTLLATMLAIVCLIPVGAQAGGNDRTGTSAAPELTIPIGARYLGFAGAGIAMVNGPEAIFWNPAGVDLALRDVNAVFAHRKYIADINVNAAAASVRFGFGTLALSLRSFNIGDIPVTTETAPDGTGEVLSPNFFVVGATYSKSLSDRTSIGVTVNLVNEAFGSVSASGVSFDFGIQYTNLVGVDGLAVGLAVKNIGTSMKYGGSGLYVNATATGSDRGETFYQTGAAAFDLPSLFELGLSYAYRVADENKVLVCAAYQNNNYYLDEYRFGIEYSFKDMFFVRGGYVYTADPAGIPTVKGESVFKNFTVGAGIELANVGGVDLAVHYAYVPANIFDSNHLVTVNIAF